MLWVILNSRKWLKSISKKIKLKLHFYQKEFFFFWRPQYSNLRNCIGNKYFINKNNIEI